MATRLKTVEFAFPALASLTDNTLTTLTQITIYLPESSKVFKSVVAVMSADGIETAAGNVTSRTLGCRLAAAGYTNHAQANLFTGSGEQLSFEHAVNLTAHFTANWTTQTSQTMDCQVLIDGTGTGAGWVNVCVNVYVTYEYDDTSVTQIKTIRIPLNCPVGALATTKPGTANATIPALDTELPETSKVYRNSFITLQGNLNGNATTDSVLNMQLDATTLRTTGNHENGLQSDRFLRYVWEIGGVLNTTTTMGFYIYGSVARYHHWQAWMTITYEFDATASSASFNSIILPMRINSPMGGTTTADYQRGVADFYIQEPTAITTKQIAAFVFWDQQAAVAGLNMRVGTGSFVTYTDNGTIMCGGNGAMVRNDSALTLARGKNSLNYDVYTTDTTDLGYSLSGFFIVNYTSGKPTQGYGAANRTIIENLGATYDGAAAIAKMLTAKAMSQPAGSFYNSSVAINYKYQSNTTSTPAGYTVLAERTAAEGGVLWFDAVIDLNATDPETGVRTVWARTSDDFYRYPSDADSNRLNPSTARRWRIVQGNAATAFNYLDAYRVQHNIDYAVTGTVSGSNGGTVNLTLHRTSDGEKLATTTRTGNGTYSFTWYDNTEDVFVEAVEGTLYLGRSGNGKAT